ncbi:hypothetical protein I7I50_05261 [Histoplasma capsulatum G186AR]|uniref:Uncharacterized protein n=1 Tax=Ajellomyces capsulatus TaxID=5037 RepID=A0A8H8D812_AJECA|nr:hypothetical protein I7I52_03520 [Histoplasma capsulatum]QSS75955.1 hypothetical protein I7I50_05261 [Histoplasma capsulatum G186AR]
MDRPHQKCSQSCESFSYSPWFAREVLGRIIWPKHWTQRAEPHR